MARLRVKWRHLGVCETVKVKGERNMAEDKPGANPVTKAWTEWERSKKRKTQSRAAGNFGT